MSVNIGPKIELQGEKGFKAQITNVTTATKTYKAEVEALKSSFDKTTSAEEKAKKTREALTTAIDKQKQKVESLKTAVEQAEAAGNTSENTLNRAKTALANATAELNRMQTELDALPNKWQIAGDKIKSVGDKISNVSSGIKNVGDKMTKGLTVPIVAVGAAAIASFKQVDTGLDLIATKTGASGEALEEMQGIAKDLFGSMPIDMETAGNAVGEVATRFDLTGDALAALSEQYIKFAQINGTDVTQSIDASQSAMAAWGLTADEAAAFLDTLTAVSQQTGIGVNDLSNYMADNVVTLTEMGFSASDAALFLGNLDKNGVDVTSTMSGLKKGLANATAEGKTMDKALADLETTLLSADTNTEAYAAAIELFGAKAGPQLAAALQDGRLSLDDLGTSLETNIGAVSTTFDATLDPIDNWTVAMNNAKLAGAELGSSIQTAAAPIIEQLTTAIQNVTTWFNSLSEGQQQTIIKTAALVAVAGPVLSVIGSIGSGIAGLVSSVGTITTAIGGAGGLTGILGGLGTAFSTVGTFITATVIPALGGVLTAIAPVLPIILGVGAAIAGVILVVKNWGAISEWFSGVWDTVTTAVSDAATAVKDGIVNAWNSVKEKTTAAWNTLKEKTTAAWNGIKTGVSNAWNGIKNVASTAGAAVKEKVTTAWSTLKSNTSTAWSNIKATVQANGGGIRGIIAGAVEGYKSVWTTGFNVIDSITGGKLSSALATVREKLESIKSAFTEKLNAAKETVSNVIEKIKGFFHFDWSLPKLKMPHLTITGGFSLFPPSVPRFSISWYKKAYNTPMLFRSPTVIPTASGLKGFGDGNGGEVVMGQSMMYAMIRDAVAEGNGETSNTWGDINVTVNGAESRDMGALADLIADRIAAKVQRRRAAWA